MEVKDESDDCTGGAGDSVFDARKLSAESDGADIRLRAGFGFEVHANSSAAGVHRRSVYRFAGKHGERGDGSVYVDCGFRNASGWHRAFVQRNAFRHANSRGQLHVQRHCHGFLGGLRDYCCGEQRFRSPECYGGRQDGAIKPRYTIEEKGDKAWLVIRIPISTLPDTISVRGGDLADDIRRQRLTARENEVYDMIMARKQNKEIADELSLSLRTVVFHVTSMFRKMGVSSRAELWFKDDRQQEGQF